MLAFVFVNLSELTRLSGVSIEIAGLNLGIQDVALWGSVAFFGALAVFLAAAMFPAPTERIVTALIHAFP
jgi:hypothetical protein